MRTAFFATALRDEVQVFSTERATNSGALVEQRGQAPTRRSALVSAFSARSEVTVLEGMDLPALRNCWASRYGDPPKIRSPELLRLMLAWRLQAAAAGGLDASVRRRLARNTGRADPQEDLPVGAELAREWKGVTQTVQVSSEGYVWRGRTFPSLSAVARTITGTRWNGPRFFGLRNKEPRA